MEECLTAGTLVVVSGAVSRTTSNGEYYLIITIHAS